RIGLNLTVIGSAPAWAESPGRPSSCYMVEIGDEALLLDLGQGSLGSLFAHRDPSTVRAVIVSHMHGDHHVDLIPLRNLLYYHYAEPRGIGLHLPAGLRKRYDAFTGEDGFLDFMEGADVTEGTSTIGPFTVQAHPVTHAENSHAFRVTDSAHPGAPGLVYSGDCGRADDLLPLIREGDTLLCEAFWSTREPIPGANHLDAAQAAGVARQGGAARLILTHILESYDPQAALQAARQVFPGPVSLAEPELVVTIGATR
ncbi:MAG: MBL fold metallo-hydrolase, partial [Chloroflexota bacterium]